jgi:hypothetical protein
MVVSMTTIPSRAHAVKGMIDKLSEQTVLPDRIYLCLPYWSKKEGREYPVPDGLSDRVTILRCEDYGPITKILPTLFVEKHPETMIITLDDDTHYPTNRLEQLVTWARSDPNAAWGGDGRVIGDRWSFWQFARPRNDRPARASILQGISGCLYRRKFFSDDPSDLITIEPLPGEDRYELVRSAHVNDDIQISGYLAMRNIPRMVHPGAIREDDAILSRTNPIFDSPITNLLRMVPVISHYQAQGVFNEPPAPTSGSMLFQVGTYTAVLPVVLLAMAFILALIFSLKYLVAWNV